jgi:hypothetical protein
MQNPGPISIVAKIVLRYFYTEQIFGITVVICTATGVIHKERYNTVEPGTVGQRDIFSC